MKNFLHIIFWVLIFFVGIFQLLGVPSVVFKPLFPLITFFLFGIELKRNYTGIKLPGIKYLLLFVALAIISTAVNGISYFAMIYFLVFLLYPFFYFYVLINDDTIALKSISRLILFLLILQIPASIIKFLYWGISEGRAVGTMATDSGSLALVFPVFVISFLLPLYYREGKKKYLVLIALFTFFGIVGEKRALFVLLPMLILYSIATYWYISSFKLEKKALKTWGLAFLGGCMLFYGIVVLNPTLNPEHRVGGSFNLPYLYNYTSRYTDSTGKGLKEMRRMGGFMYFASYVSSDAQRSVLGDGAGKLAESSFLPGEGTMLANYGVRYGGRMAFIYMLLQVGVLGTILYLMIHFEIFLKIRKKFKGESNNILYIGYANLIFVLLFDFMLYSSITIQADVIYCLYMFVIAYLYNENEELPFLIH